MSLKNTRRDVSLKPTIMRREKKKSKPAIKTAILAIGIVTLLLVSIGIVTTMPIKGTYATRHAITVDGDPSDWTGTASSSYDTGVVDGGEWIWNDSVNDERNDFNNNNPDERVDLTEFRVTGDSSYIYFMAKFKNMSSFYLGDNGATWMAIAIDNGTTGGETWFAGSSDTQCNSSAAWEYQIVVNLADSRYAGKNMNYTTYPLNESTANWGSIFYVINKTWKFQNFTGDNGEHGMMAVNLTTGTIEIKIAWSVLGLNPANKPTINISVITARGYSDYSSNSGNTWDSNGNSDALDCITTQPTTWDEVQDGVVNDYASITFDSSGNVVDSTFVPEFNGIYIVPMIAFVFSLVVIRRH